MYYFFLGSYIYVWMNAWLVLFRCQNRKILNRFGSWVPHSKFLLGHSGTIYSNKYSFNLFAPKAMKSEESTWQIWIGLLVGVGYKQHIIVAESGWLGCDEI